MTGVYLADEFDFAHASLISLTQAACRLRSARAHFVRRPVGLASALSSIGREFITTVIPVKTGIQCQSGRRMQPRVDSRFRGNDG